MQPNKNSIWAKYRPKKFTFNIFPKKLHAILSKSEFQEFWTRSMVFRVIIIIFWSNSELNFSPKKYIISSEILNVFTPKVIAMPTAGWVNTQCSKICKKICNWLLFASKRLKTNIFFSQMKWSLGSLWSAEKNT